MKKEKGTEISTQASGTEEDKTGLPENKFLKLADAAKNAVVHTIDKNGNGKIDREDIGLSDENISEAKKKAKFIAGAMGKGTMDLAAKASEKAREGSTLMGETLEKARLEMERKTLQPVFPNELTAEKDGVLLNRAHLPRMVCVVARDKKRSESDVCKGAIGYRENIKGLEILNIYQDYARQSGIHFYPHIEQTVYYVNPYQENFYISLDDFFAYLKKARVNELETIAQALGAKHVRISFREQKKTFVSQKGNAAIKVTGNAGNGEFENAAKEYSSEEIATDVKFSGHSEPRVPELIYFKNETDIAALVQMRLSTGANKFEAKTFHFQCGRMSGIKEKEAGQIDAVLGQMKIQGSASVSSEAQKESRTDIEYSIEF